MKSKRLILLVLTLVFIFSSVNVCSAAGYGGNADANWITHGNYYKGLQLFSPNHKYMFTLQNDGNVVLYNTTTWKALWVAPNTWNNTDYFVLSGKYGFQCVKYDTANSFHFSYQIPLSGAEYMSMQNDGNLVIYNTSWKALWCSNTWGQ